ncbi:MAG: lactate utilization protein [Thermoguttaceae bacterium]
MNSRDTILQRIRAGLTGAAAAGFSGLTAPPVPEIWPQENPDKTVLAGRFAAELQAVFGETIRCATVEEARRQLAALLGDAAPGAVGAADTPLARDVAAAVAPDRVVWAEPGWKPAAMAELSAGLLTADCLLADTGTCLIACRTDAERLLCYLPPTCIVLARLEQLAKHLPAAWQEIACRCADPQACGEFVLVTGPSRTADIEKILILGVHGPKRLVVLLID